MRLNIDTQVRALVVTVAVLMKGKQYRTIRRLLLTCCGTFNKVWIANELLENKETR